MIKDDPGSIPEALNDLFGFHDRLARGSSVHLFDLLLANLVEMCLIGVENMIVAQEILCFFFQGDRIGALEPLPEHDQGGLFTLADTSSVGSDLLKSAVHPALEVIVGQHQPVDAPVDMAIEAHRGDRAPHLLPTAAIFKVGDNLFGDRGIDF